MKRVMKRVMKKVAGGGTIRDDVEVTFVTGPKRSGKTRLAYALCLDLSPRDKTVWFDEDSAARDMGADCLLDVSRVLTGREVRRVIISASDSAALGFVLKHLGGSPLIRVVRCEEPRYG